MAQENPGGAAEAKQGRDAPGGEPRGLWGAEASLWTDRMVSAPGSGARGGHWFGLIDEVMRPASLDLAWQRVAPNKGAAGVDGRSMERFSHRSEGCLAERRRSLADGSYRPNPVKRGETPKGDGKTRPLGTPAVRERIVRTALKTVIEPIFEVLFRPASFGFRPGRGCEDALAERLPDGAPCRRLRGLGCDGSAGDSGAAPGNGVGEGQRPDPTPRQDAERRQRTTGPRVRLPGYRFEAGRRLVRAKSLPPSRTRRGTERSTAGVTAWGGSSPTSTRRRGGGSATSSTPGRACSEPSTASSADGSAFSRASTGGGRQGGAARPISRHGPMPSSRVKDCSPRKQPSKARDIPDEATRDWRAVRGRTARTLRRAGWVNTLPEPCHGGWGPAAEGLWSCVRGAVWLSRPGTTTRDRSPTASPDPPVPPASGPSRRRHRPT